MKEFTPYDFVKSTKEEVLARARTILSTMQSRRSIRAFSSEPVPREVIEHLIATASSAPSGANKQPWTFCLVGDPEFKSKIRRAAEKEEYENYHGRMSPEWIEDLKPFGTDWHKEFLEKAPWLVVLFKKPYEIVNGRKRKNYYVNESVGIAAGFFIMALHQAGLVTLTHTPSPMNFLEDILDRPDNERAYLLLPVGYPSADAQVPVLEKKALEDVMETFE